jgi:hypothetical protein
MSHKYKLEVKEENDHHEDIVNFILQGMDDATYYHYFDNRPNAPSYSRYFINRQKVEYKADIKLIWNSLPDKIWIPEHIHIERDDGPILSLEYVLEIKLIEETEDYNESYEPNSRKSFVVRTNTESEEILRELLNELFRKYKYINNLNDSSALIREICKHKELVYNPTPIISVRSIKFIEKHGFDCIEHIEEALKYLDSQHKKYEECLRNQRTGRDIDQIVCSYSFMPAVEDDE